MKYSEVLKVIEMTFKPPKKQIKTIFIRGYPGIGKTSLAYDLKKRYEEKTGKEWLLIKRRISDLFAEDFSGLPQVDEDQGVTKWYPPDFLPLKESKIFENTQGILLLDEFNRAKPDVLQAVMKVLDRDGFLESWLVIATGNLGGEDGTDVEELDAAQERRFLFLDLDFDIMEWKKWAINAQISPEIIDFLSESPNFALFKYADSKFENGYVTPAHWEEFDRYLKQNINNIKGIKYIISPHLLKEAATPFWKFYETKVSVS